MKDKSKYSLASKERWAKIEPAERSKIMRTVALKKWSMMSIEDKHAHAMKMVAGRGKNDHPMKNGI